VFLRQFMVGAIVGMEYDYILIFYLNPRQHAALVEDLTAYCRPE